MPSLREALEMIGSISAMPWNPPGWLCETRGGVLVSTESPRQRMAGGWYISETMRPGLVGIALRIVGTVVANRQTCRWR